MRGASASAAFQRLRGRDEDLSDGLKRRDVPALRVPSHLTKYDPYIGIFEIPIRRKGARRHVILHGLDFPTATLKSSFRSYVVFPLIAIRGLHGSLKYVLKKIILFGLEKKIYVVYLLKLT